MNTLIDLRSDTVTHPTTQMRQAMANALAEIPGITIDPQSVDTNIVFFRLTAEDRTASALAQNLAQSGILVHVLGDDTVRAVTHYHITDADIDNVAEAVRKAVTPR